MHHFFALEAPFGGEGFAAPMLAAWNPHCDGVGMRYKAEMSRTPSTPAPLPQIKPAALCDFHRKMAVWYAREGRHDLPWRQTDDAYAIWISEVMLQQTQVSTVLARFYHPFLAKFPTIEALAKAPCEAVMKAWEGLGYYRRAGFLHEAAKEVVRRELSVFSKDIAPIGHNSLTTDDSQRTTLLSLPGIGRNTAHAILAFAHHRPVAILEANVKRVVARIFALEMPNEAQLWAGAQMLLNAHEPFDHNQAMMDLGAQICTPKRPDCARCPAHSMCRGKGAPENYPTPKTKKQTPTRYVDILVREDAVGKLHLEPRKAALLGGLYGFVQVSRESFRGSRKQKIPHDSPLTPHDCLGTVTHVYSHFRLEGRVLHTRLEETMSGAPWYNRAEIAALPLSTVDHKVLALVDKCNSRPKKHAQSPVARATALTTRGTGR